MLIHKKNTLLLIVLNMLLFLNNHNSYANSNPDYIILVKCINKNELNSYKKTLTKEKIDFKVNLKTNEITVKQNDIIKIVKTFPSKYPFLNINLLNNKVKTDEIKIAYQVNKNSDLSENLKAISGLSNIKVIIYENKNPKESIIKINIQKGETLDPEIVDFLIQYVSLNVKNLSTENITTEIKKQD